MKVILMIEKDGIFVEGYVAEVLYSGKGLYEVTGTGNIINIIA